MDETEKEKKWSGKGDMTKYHQQLQLTALTRYPPRENLKTSCHAAKPHTHTHIGKHAHTHTHMHTISPQSAPHVSSGCRSMADLMRYFKRVCHASVSPPTPQTKSRGPWSVKREPRPSMDGQLPCWAKWNWWAATHCARHMHTVQTSTVSVHT